MAIDPASILAMAQIVRIAADVFTEHQKGELTEEGLAAAWSAIYVQASDGRRQWEESKETPAAMARRAEADNQGVNNG